MERRQSNRSGCFLFCNKRFKECKTDQEALTTASNVWSSLGEDNALKVITSLGDVNDSYKDVEGSMQKSKTSNTMMSSRTGKASEER